MTRKTGLEEVDSKNRCHSNKGIEFRTNKCEFNRGSFESTVVCHVCR